MKKYLSWTLDFLHLFMYNEIIRLSVFIKKFLRGPKMKKLQFVFLILLFCFISLDSQAHPLQLEIPKDVRSLSEAIEQIQPRGEILLSPGTYEILTTIELSKPLKIRGTGNEPGEVVLQGKEKNVFFIHENGNVELANLTIQNEGTFHPTPTQEEKAEFEKHSQAIANSAAVRIQTPFCKFSGCIISSVHSSGVVVERRGCRPVFESCRIENCGSVGIWLFPGAEGVYADCKIRRNSKAGMVYGGMGSSPNIIGTLFSDGLAEGILICGDSRGAISSEFRANAGAGICVQSSSASPKISNSRFYDGETVGILFRNAVGEVCQCGFYGRLTAGIRIEGPRSRVSLTGNWFGDKSTSGILCTEGAACMVTGTAFQNQKEGVGIQIEGENTRVQIRDTVFAECACTGFYIRDKASPEIMQCRMRNHRGTGFLIQEEAAPQIRECGIVDLEGVGFEFRSGACGTMMQYSIERASGPGIILAGTGTSPSIRDSRFQKISSAPGIQVQESANAEFTNCVFQDCAGDGGHLSGKGTSVTFYSCRFGDSITSCRNGVVFEKGAVGRFEKCNFSKFSNCVFLSDPDTEAEFKECTFHEANVGLRAANGAKCSLFAVRFCLNSEFGMMLQGTGTSSFLSGETCFVRNCQGGVKVMDGATAVLEQCELRKHPAALEIEGTEAVVTVRKTIFSENEVGVQVKNGASGILKECDFKYCSTGVAAEGEGTYTEMTQCTLGPKNIVGIQFADQAAGKVLECQIFGGRIGIRSVGAKTIPEFTNCTVKNCREWGIQLKDGGSGCFRKNTVQENGLHESSDVIFLDGSGDWDLSGSGAELILEENLPALETLPAGKVKRNRQ